MLFRILVLASVKKFGESSLPPAHFEQELVQKCQGMKLWSGLDTSSTFERRLGVSSCARKHACQVVIIVEPRKQTKRYLDSDQTSVWQLDMRNPPVGFVASRC